MKTYLELFFCFFVLIANFSLFCTFIYEPELRDFLSIFLRVFKMYSMYVMWFIMCCFLIWRIIDLLAKIEG